MTTNHDYWNWLGGTRRPTVPPSEMRVSDAERNEIAELLSRHFADGRLDQAEFDERMSRAMAAKTRADLAPLLDDLPPVGPAGGPEPPPPPARPRHLARIAALAFLVVLALNAVTWAVRPHMFGFGYHVPWLFVALVVFLVLRARRGPFRRGGYVRGW